MCACVGVELSIFRAIYVTFSSNKAANKKHTHTHHTYVCIFRKAVVDNFAELSLFSYEAAKSLLQVRLMRTRSLVEKISLKISEKLDLT